MNNHQEQKKSIVRCDFADGVLNSYEKPQSLRLRFLYHFHIIAGAHTGTFFENLGKVHGIVAASDKFSDIRDRNRI